MKSEQLSFLKAKDHIEIEYDANICYRCLCSKCKYSVEIYPFIDEEECKEVIDKSCFNCDECYYYGMDNENLSRNKIKFECDKFEMSNYYKELEVKRRRQSFKVI
ncbi:hypothetical protein G8V03_09555 [Clostridium botulinum D/C]|uniref:hypothetical protein n=1 Tax=Clostridium botulinum TaxID=1491 RepID=UPI001E3555BD|nr:hypothetical protein [Clostridium botulinum]MCD3351233.1 hypothetical protein [Clostridium botulinum D/C]MCD3360190.1 hypothetical protein [Clostridium botulinum D/C]MCD3361707.1 hypothetical protein [Clostridium botulinum D/C]MCD3365995.1 hypothetical protein [Clostridium botulinum D/C]